MLPHRKKRLQNILLLVGSSFIGIFLILTALNSQLNLFYSPSELNKNNLPQERIKLGGMVKKGSIKYEDTKVFFVLTDFEEDLDIEFVKIKAKFSTMEFLFFFIKLIKFLPNNT